MKKLELKPMKGTKNNYQSERNESARRTRFANDNYPANMEAHFLVPYGRTRMIVFPLTRSVGLKAATASSRVAILPMFVRSRSSRTRWAISLSWGDRTRQRSRPPGCRAVRRRSPAFLRLEQDPRTASRCRRRRHRKPCRRRRRLPASRSQGLRTPARRNRARLTVDSASGTDDVGAGLTCELCRHRADCAGRTVHEDALPRPEVAVLEQTLPGGQARHCDASADREVNIARQWREVA